MKGSLVFSICLVFIILTGFSSLAGETRVTVYGDEGYPPYSYYRDGKMKGIYVDIIREADVRMKGFSIFIRLLDWENLLVGARQGNHFAVFPPYFRPGKRSYLGTYSVPILEEETAVFCNKDVLGSPRPRWPDDYLGLRIGKNEAYDTGGKRFDKAVRDGRITVVEAPDTETMVRKLLAGEVDCYINDRNAVLWTVKLQNDDDLPYRYGIVEGAVIRREQGFMAYSEHYEAPFKQQFIREFNDAILSMQQDGFIDAIVRSYIH